MREYCGMSGWVGRLSGRYSKNSIFGATQNATRALPGHRITGRSVIGAYAKRPGGSARARLRRLHREPVNDRAAGRLPHPRMGGNMAEHLVEMPDAPRLPHDPRVQVQ